ncbi:MAG TPA: PAS domain S-box protein [Pyrinomonadaceae bacterium]
MDESLDQNFAPLDPLPYLTSFPVVGLGSSAGGLEALKDFFAHVPANSGMAFVVIMHLSPKHESHVAKLLQATTAMPVMQVTETVRVEPDNVYVIPPTKNLEMSDGQIILTEPEPLHQGKQAVIDLFFRTLAETHKEHAVGIVLSGMGSDGTNGLKRIKEHNGLAFAQDPQEAEHDSMPNHAIESGLVDFVLRVAQMPEKLVEIWRNTIRIKLPPETEPPSIISQEDLDEEALRDIFKLLRLHTGHDFTHYKRATILRRIGRRLQVNGLHDIQAYDVFMNEHPLEAQSLLRDLLISVTGFFRDRAAFVEFEREVVPRLFQDKSSVDQVRVWVVGCATGEEAYSVAMLLLEYAQRLAAPPEIQIFATDIDEAALRKARRGLYNEMIETDVSPERLRNFFTKERNGYRIRKELRERVLFALHNLIKDPPFSKLDAVTCRNLLIYINRKAQLHILELFHYLLLPSGFLFLGDSESSEAAANLFTTVDKKHRISRAETDICTPARLPSLPLRISVAPDFVPRTEKVNLGPKLSVTELHQKLLEQYLPCSVMVDSHYDIVHISNRADRFLRFAEGEPSHNLLKVVHSELRFELRTALFQAAQTGRSFSARPVLIQRGEDSFYAKTVVRPVTESVGEMHNFFLIFFEAVAGLTSSESGQSHGGASDSIVELLEEELQRSREHEQATIEQYETQSEELKASNEELQAMNEELRSASEELETGKEELESVNEEIQTINGELKQNIDELAIANSNLQNLIASTDLATIFIDTDLTIKFFTPQAKDLFNLIPSDIERPLSDITHKLVYADLLHDVKHVLAHVRNTEREVSTRDGRWYIARITPYRSTGNIIDGVILTFVDFTARKLAQRSLHEAKERLRLLVESTRDHAIYTMDADGRIDYWNTGAQALFGYTESEVLGQHATLLTPQDSDRKEFERQIRKAGEKGSAEDERWYVRKDGTRFYASGVLTRLQVANSESDSSAGFAMIARDLTKRKTTEQAIEESVRFQAHLLDTVEQAVIATNLDGIVIYWNQFAQLLYGWSSIEAIGHHVIELTTPEAKSEEALEILSLLRQGQSWSGEFNVQRRDGTTFPAQIINSPINDDSGKLIGIVGLSIDITERKRVERALRESENKYRLLVEQASDGIHTYDMEGNIIETNSKLCEMLGYNSEELLRLNVNDLIPAEDLATDPIRFAELRAGKTMLTERRLRRRDGELLNVEISGRMIQDNVLQAIIRDTTERKRQEESLIELTRQLKRQTNIFNTTLSSISDFAYIFDRDGRFLYANQPLLDLWGLTLDEAVGKNFFDLQYPDDLAARLQHQIERVFETGQVIRDETPYTSPTGAQGFYEYIFTPVKAADGTVEAVAGSTRDYTERRRTEATLRDAQERLLEAMDAAKMFSWEVNSKTREISFSSNVERAMGFTFPSDIINDPSKNHIHPEDLERGLEKTLLALETGEPYDDTVRMVSPYTGEVVWMHSQGILARNVEGDANLIGIAQNITERKHTEVLLDAQKQALEMIVCGTPLAEVLKYLAGIVEHQAAGSSVSAIMLLDEQGRLHNGAAPSLPADYVQAVEGLKADENVGTCSAAAATGKAVISPDIAADPKWRILKDLPLGLGFQSAWSLPIMAADERVLGTFGTYFRSKRQPTRLEQQMVEILARTAALAIERHEAEEALRISETKLQRSHQHLERRVRERTTALSEMNAVLQEQILERRRIEGERIELLRRIVFAQEDERHRIAREMHDQLGQQLTVLKLKLDAIQEDCGADQKLRERVEALQMIATQLDKDVDQMVREMRPTALDDLGLQTALSGYVKNWSKNFGVSVQLHISGLEEDRLTSEVETALYRAAQECLNNVAKHAQANNVAIVLERHAGQVSLFVEDDGLGFEWQLPFPANDKGLGLIGMRERAALVGGTLEIESQPGDGTTVVVRIPISQQSNAGKTNE